MFFMASDDLRFPDKLIADEYFERPISEKKSGVGSMPGKSHEEAEAEKHEEELISGRGCVP